MTNISIHVGSILDCNVDAIVNPANSFLRHGGGLAAVIAKAAAPAGHWNSLDDMYHMGGKEDDLKQFEPSKSWLREQIDHPNIATGNAGWTSAGALPYKGIIHAVGPIWEGGIFYERELLKLAHVSIVGIGLMNNIHSIAIPAISCGVFGFPVDIAAPIAVETMKNNEWVFDKIVFALMDKSHIEEYSKYL